MNRPEIIFFDVAFTLIHPRPSVGAIYAATAAEFGTNVDPAAIDAGFGPAWKAARAAVEGLPYGPTDADARAFWRSVVAQTFQHAGSSMPADPYFDTVFDRFASKDCWAVYDDVRPAFDHIKTGGARIGVLSNFDSRLRPLLASLELHAMIDHVIISCEVGAEKPAPAIFRAAEKIAGVAPIRAALIGDLEREDYGGAIAAGWQAALIDRKAAPEPPRRFNNLLDAVAALLP